MRPVCQEAGVSGACLGCSIPIVSSYCTCASEGMTEAPAWGLQTTTRIAYLFENSPDLCHMPGTISNPTRHQKNSHSLQQLAPAKKTQQKPTKEATVEG